MAHGSIDLRKYISAGCGPTGSAKKSSSKTKGKVWIPQSEAAKSLDILLMLFRDAKRHIPQPLRSQLKDPIEPKAQPDDRLVLPSPEHDERTKDLYSDDEEIRAAAWERLEEQDIADYERVRDTMTFVQVKHPQLPDFIPDGTQSDRSCRWQSVIRWLASSIDILQKMEASPEKAPAANAKESSLPKGFKIVGETLTWKGKSVLGSYVKVGKKRIKIGATEHSALKAFVEGFLHTVSYEQISVGAAAKTSATRIVCILKKWLNRTPYQIIAVIKTGYSMIDKP